MPTSSAPHGNPSPAAAPNAGKRTQALTNPNLSASLRADYEALQNDLRQARELALDLQQQLAGKSNEFADLKRVFEKTRNDLVRLSSSISELREERHRLANQAMHSVAFERKITERDAIIGDLKAEIETLQKQLAKGEEKAASEMDGGSRSRRLKWLR